MAVVLWALVFWVLRPVLTPPESALVQLAMEDLEGATAIRGLAEVEMGRIEGI